MSLPSLARIAASHGELCACLGTLPLHAVGLDAQTYRELADRLKELGEDASLSALYRHWQLLGEGVAKALDVVAAIREFASRECWTQEPPNASDVVWAFKRPLGFRTFAERWPDDVEEYEWSAWVRGDLDVNLDPMVGWDVLRRQALDETPPTEFTYRTVDDYVPFVVERDTAEHQEGLDLELWPTEKRLRVLLAMRDGATDPVSVARLAAETQNSAESVRLLMEYLDQAERGTAAKDPVTALLLQRYPPERTADVVRIVAMADAEAREAAEAAVEEEPELLEARDAFIFAAAERPPVAPDGGPDPLAIVRQLLPGGAGVLGPPPIIYTPTLLDQKLLPAMRESPPTLVVLSGNAGDGKTAFIASVLDAAGEPYDATRNIYDVSVGPNHYLIVLDGSEDTEDLTNAQLLEKALGAFWGDRPTQPERGTLIAVNKGRLLHFLENNRSDYPYLWNLASSRFLGEPGGDANTPYHLIDLNERSMLAPDPDRSVFGGIVRKLVEWPAWDTDCRRCPAVSRCPVREAIVQLREPVARRQLWRVLSAADLDDRVHVTARHLVTKVADAVVGDHRCADVRSRVESGERFSSEDRFTSRLFIAESALHAESTVMNRVVSTYDPSEHSSPARDRRIVYRLLDPPTMAGTARDVLATDEASAEAARTISTLSVDDKPAPGSPDFRERLVGLVRHAARRLYFVAPDDGLAPPSALTVQDRYVAALAGGDLTGLVPGLARQLNATLGIGDGDLGGLLVPRDYTRGLAGTGFAALIPAATLDLVAATHNGATFAQQNFLEAWPRGMLLTMRDGERIVARLLLSFLMLEVLDRAGRGFRPLGQTEKSYMVRLGGFYRKAAEHTWSTPPTYVLYRSGKLLQARIDANRLGLGIH